MRTTILISGLAAAVAACGGDSTTCGTGTTKQGNECIADNGGSNSGSNTGSNGNDTTCGAGTHLMGTMCVPDDNTVQAAPTITMMTPTEAGIAGGGLFTITGTGFVGSNVTDLHVFFGDPTNMNCEATLGAASATEVSGQVPGDCKLSPSVTVTLQTNVGSATTAFTYDMLFAADGDGGGDFAHGGDIYVIDPFAQLSFDLTPNGLSDAQQNAYGFGAMDFNSTGTLFIATTGDSPADLDGASQLISIDLSTGTPTLINDIADATNLYSVVDMKFVGGTLYGWAFYDDATNGFEHTLISIDPATGAATMIGTPTPDTSFFGALAVDASSNLLVAPSGAGADNNSAVPTTGELDTVNTTDGTLSNTAILDWPVGSPIDAMTTFTTSQGPLILGVVDNGQYGVINGGVALYNETLAVIDPSMEKVSPAFELPGKIGAQPHIDALAVPPATLVISRDLPRTGWTKLATAAGGHPLAH